MLRLRDIPNLITLARIVSVVPLAWLIALQMHGWALALGLAAGASDAIDGLLAKRFGWESRLGGVLDPIADKLLLVSAFIVLTAQGHLPLWLLALVILRDVVIVVGGIAYHYLVAPFDAAPMFVSKLNTLLQILLVLGVLAALSVTPWLQPWVAQGCLAVAVTTVISGLQYVWVYGRLAMAGGKK
ncbi:MAG: CDP-alcohol phosphatidyltransferase [Lysobacteraceae bacterium]|nr:MAG: CDP-alcohol phosphatidyltransferase [Xanthomonadaceae bacterium]